jgi:hypothetical protein
VRNQSPQMTATLIDFSPAFEFTLEEIPVSYNKLTLLPALLCASAVFGQGAPKSAHADIVNAPRPENRDY